MWEEWVEKNRRNKFIREQVAKLEEIEKKLIKRRIDFVAEIIGNQKLASREIYIKLILKLQALIRYHIYH